MDQNHYQDHQPQPAKTNVLLPFSIIIAGIIIAGAIFLVKKDSPVAKQATQSLSITVNPVTPADHVLGNPNAKVSMIEFSDTDCPFCQRFHPELQKLVDKYGKDGKLAWAYRHFAFHERAPKEAEATECAAEIGGNDKFWEYLNKVFAAKHFQTSATDKYVGIEVSQLPVLAESIGIDKAKFSTCLTSGKYATKVKQQYDEAVSAGAVGTPHTVIISEAPLNRATIDFIEQTNLQILTRQGTGGMAPFSVSNDGTKLIVSGAMQATVMDQIIQLIIQANYK
ncbi:MAG: thioredoxin domain-containing protein [Patescibacteria group bacterium]